MKVILFCCIAVLGSCSKDDCEKCTRTWKYKTYVVDSYNTQTGNATTYDGGTETFYACGDEMIEAEEKGRTSYAKTPVPNYSNRWNVVEGTGTCNCN